jgi:pimeloyl-ACP methyl ester carboxylesterase
VAWIAAVVVTLAALGVLTQQIGLRRQRRICAFPGRLIDVGGHRLHAYCVGRARPTVLLESGIAASSISWSLVQPAIAEFARACAYDRAGLGWSDAATHPRTFRGIVDDLASLVEAVAPGERFVFVGHSFGSFIVRAYAAHHPDRTIGLVLVDPAVEWLAATRERARLLRGGRQLSRLGVWLAHLGVVRVCLALLTGGAPGAPRRFVKIFGPTAARTLERLVGEVRKLPPQVYPIVKAHWCQPKCFRAMADHLDVLEREGDVIAAIAPPPTVPVTVISSGHQPPAQLDVHRRLAETSTSGRHMVAARSTHWVPFDEPELIVRAVRELARLQPGDQRPIARANSPSAVS